MGSRIVLVEDNPEVRRFSKMLLTRKKFEVEDYPNGQDALEAILANPPDLVISDVQMPKLDGLGMTAQLREHFDKSSLPIVLVSVMSEEEDIVRGFEAGANDYLVKPYRATELLAKVKILLKEGPFLRRKDEPELPKNETKADILSSEEETRALPRLSSNRYFFDKYEITGEYGRGGMGTVYKAIKRDDSRPVALKVLAPRLSEHRKSIARFLREIKLLTEIDSPHIVSVYDHGFDGGRYFLAMEAVDGESLDRISLQAERLEEDFVAKVFQQVAQALEALEERNLVHRDVKPANILVCENTDVKLVDFGLAKQQGDTLHLSDDGFALGTPYYLAPEIIKGKEASIQSDLFSMGVAMFEVLTGRRPFPGVVPYQIFRLIVSELRPDPRDHREDLSEDMVAIIAKLLARDCSARYQRPEEVVKALGEWLERRAS